VKKYLSLLLVWAGQIVSLFGSGLTGFALGVWLYQRTGSASNFALVALCTALPQMILSPLAGVWIDRYNRRWMMALADSGAALCTLTIAALFFSGHIQVWHIFLLTALSSSCGTFQAPAYSALVATSIPKEQLARANGMIQLGQGLAEILAPALSGVLLAVVGIPGVLLIDLVTYLIGISTLLFSRIPAAPPAKTAFHTKDQNLWSEAKVGLRAMSANTGLRALLSFQALFSFLWNIFAVLVVPMALGFATPEQLGIMLTVAGAGLLSGSLVMSAWGGPKRRLMGLLFFELVSAVAFVLMGLRPNLLLVAGAAFLAHFTLAFVSSLNETLWQGQTPAEVQGRVFALKQAVTKAAVLVAYIAAGGLADRVVDPLLQPGGQLAGSLGLWVGVGPGRGIAAMFILIGLVKGAAAIWLASSPLSSKVETQVGQPRQHEPHGA
jgi:MFS transporter, DHA3 family, macrolide efflux protein